MSKFKFSVGPWNVHGGADGYGPATRQTICIEEKFKKFKEYYIKSQYEAQLMSRGLNLCFLHNKFVNYESQRLKNRHTYDTIKE